MLISLSDQTDKSALNYYIEVTQKDSSGSGYILQIGQYLVTIKIVNELKQSTALILQQTMYTAQVELTGNSTAYFPWNNLDWTIDGSASTEWCICDFPALQLGNRTVPKQRGRVYDCYIGNR